MSRSRSRRWEILSTVVAPLAICAAGVGVFLLLSSLKKDPQRNESKKEVLTVETEPVALLGAADGFTIEVSGIVVPYREIKISSEVTGKITEKKAYCRPGRYVEGNKDLIKIDPQDYQLDHDRYEAEVKQAEQSIKELKAEIEGADKLVEIAKQDVELKNREFQRAERLMRVQSEAEFEQAKQNLLSARNALQTQENQHRLLSTRMSRLETTKRLSEIQLNKAAVSLKRTSIAAPANGVIVSTSVEQGDFVQAGTELLVFEDTSKAEISCNLTADQLYWVLQNQTGTRLTTVSQARQPGYELPETDVKIEYDFAGQLVTWNGRLSRYDGIGVDEKTRTVPCRVTVDQPVTQTGLGSLALVRGMYVKVKITIRPRDAMLRVPGPAVRPGNVIWAVRNSKLVRCPAIVASHRRSEDLDPRKESVIVKLQPEGLQAGDRVVVTALKQMYGMDEFDGLEVVENTRQ